MYYEAVPQRVYKIDGIPAAKCGEWPGIKSNHWLGSVKVIHPKKTASIFDDNIIPVEKNRKHFKEKHGYEKPFRTMARQFQEIRNRTNIEEKKTGLKSVDMKFTQNKTFYPKKHFPPKYGYEKVPQPFYIRTYHPGFNTRSEKETTVERAMGAKRRIFDIEQQRNGMKMRNPGDKFYKTSEQFPNFFKEGGLIVGSTNTENFNKTQSRKAYNFYETLDLKVPTLDPQKIYKNREKMDELQKDQKYVMLDIDKWERNILADFEPDYLKKKKVEEDLTSTSNKNKKNVTDKSNKSKASVKKNK